jgi:hypothetical protein
MSTSEMLRQSLMEEEVGKSMWLWDACIKKCRYIGNIMRRSWNPGKKYNKAWIWCIGKLIKTLTQIKWIVLYMLQHPNPIEEGINKGMAGNQGVWEGIIIPQDNPLGPSMRNIG